MHNVNIQIFTSAGTLRVQSIVFLGEISLAALCTFLCWVKNVKLASGHVTLIKKRSDTQINLPVAIRSLCHGKHRVNVACQIHFRIM